MLVTPTYIMDVIGRSGSRVPDLSSSAAAEASEAVQEGVWPSGQTCGSRVNPSERLVHMAAHASCRAFPGSVRALVGRPEPSKGPPGWPV